MDRYVCVHGHFYQPPRENPWLEVVEEQDSSRPYHDWNQRITDECYGPNTAARVLGDDGRIQRLVNNYGWTSFNIGPTLLAWMADHAEDVHAAIVQADRRSADRFGGHGSAMAQVYNHMILPLANERDQRTQVRWGLHDFRHRFGREPEGMWLAETAADTASLEALAAEGVRFTVLSPFQAAQVRPAGAADWTDVAGGRIDTTRAYRVPLPSGRSIAVFFYDARVSQGVAFEGLLYSGDRFADRLLGAFTDRAGPQLVHIATDGESYGHHHRHGEMALAHALQRLRLDPTVRLTNYAEFLELHPPVDEVRIVEGSSWSCAHGIERWRADCGCSNGETGGSQAWRAPLREALDLVRDELAPRYEQAAALLVHDPWAARDDYIRVVLDRSPEQLETFLAAHVRRPLTPAETTQLLRLLELQRHAMLMYTSCGWFFDEVSRIETVQVLAYAARALELAEQTLDVTDLTPRVLKILAAAPSNLPEIGDGRAVFERTVQPLQATFPKVAAHFAISGLFRRYGPTERLGCYEVERRIEHRSEAGRARVGFGRMTVRSVITRREDTFEYGVLHFGDHNFQCGVRRAGSDEDYQAMAAAVEAAFAEADFPATVRTLDQHFGDSAYSLRDLFRDEQRRLLRVLLDSTLDDVESTYRAIYRARAPLLRFLAGVEAQLPAALRSTAEVVLNAELRAALVDDIDPSLVRSLIDEAARFRVTLETDELAHAFGRTVQGVTDLVRDQLDDPSTFTRFGRPHERFFERLDMLVDVAESLPFEVDLSRAQNLTWQVIVRHRPTLRTRAEAGDPVARRWLDGIDHLAARLRFVVSDGATTAGVH